MMQQLKYAVPWTLIALRLLCCPLIVTGALAAWPGRWLGLIVVFALLSDIYDGILARCWDNETPALRVSDSVADTVFYLGVLAALWFRKPQLIRSNFAWFAALLTLEALRYIFDWLKYRRTASYHSYLAKAWGLILAFAMVCVFIFPDSDALARLALDWGIVVNLEGLVMSLLLPRWKNDVKTLAQAWRLRKTMFAE